MTAVMVTFVLYKSLIFDKNDPDLLYKWVIVGMFFALFGIVSWVS